MSKNYWDNNKKGEYWEQKVADQTSVGSATSGLQQFMVQTFTWMCLGLALTGVVSLATYSTPAVFELIFGNQFLFWGLIIAEFGMVIGFSRVLAKGGSPTVLLTMFLSYAVLNGLTLSIVLFVYTFESVASTFFISSAMFGGVALYGYVTKKDLTGLGRMAGMAVWGLIVAMLINMFMQSSMLATGISMIGVLVFTALTAYDTQKLKHHYSAYQNDATALKRAALGGALMLYLDFINLFLMLLRLMGNRR